ncbi:MAG TPA: site-specific integrase [Vicinamibacterales bacterium]|jgi:integrase|nr:site-specific integrase [Vicinamibacterales bacterium]
MRALIGPDLLRKLPAGNVEIRDTKLTGFTLRCRASGVHVYRMTLARGDTRTLGRVKDLTPEAARLAAEGLVSSVSRDALKHMADDPTLATRDARAKARGAVKAGLKKRITWKTYLDTHYEPFALANRKRGADLIRRLRVSFASFDDLLLSEISAFGIERWRAQRAKTRIGNHRITSATIDRDLSALRGGLSRALEWRLIAAHPMHTVKPAKVDATAHCRYLSADEETRLLAALDARDAARARARHSANEWRELRGYDRLPVFGVYTDALNPLVRLALHTGCRRGELLALHWRDIDLTAARLTVRADTTKTGEARYIPLNRAIVAVLRAWRPADADLDACVFPGVDDDTALTTVKKSWGGVLKAANITGFRFHDLRHTFASKLVMAGVDLNTVRELLGHSDIKMTLRYAHLAPEHKMAAVEKLVSA